MVTLLKLVAACFVEWTDDITNAHHRAAAFLDGVGPLRPEGAMVFPLIADYAVWAGCLALARVTGMTFGIVAKAPAILADLAIAWLLLAHRAGRPAALLYIFSPVSLVLSVYHGQIHTVAVLGAVWALHQADRGRASLAGLALALAGSVRQHFVALTGALARDRRSRLAAAATCAAVLVAVNAPVLLRPGEVAEHQRTIAPYGAWGASLLVLQTPRVLALAGWQTGRDTFAAADTMLRAYGQGLALMWIAAVAVVAWLRPHADRWRLALVLATGTCAVMTGIGVQYLIWALPFYAVVAPRLGVLYSVVGGAWIVASYSASSLVAKYKVPSFTARLEMLQGSDIALTIATGLLGVATWAVCAYTAWHGMRAVLRETA